MGWGTGNLGGGSGGGLNFKVVGNPQPVNPKENTIWLNTDVKITGYSFAAEQPEKMSEGEVWISTGTASQVAFTAIKKGTVMVYPLSAKQMGQDGVLVDVTAKSYQDGAWADWYFEEWIIKNGQTDYEFVLAGMTMTSNDNSILFKGNSGEHQEAYIIADLTHHNTLVIKGILSTTTGSVLAVWDTSIEPKYNNAVAYTPLSAEETMLDISNLTGKYKIGFTKVSNRTHEVTDFGLTR